MNKITQIEKIIENIEIRKEILATMPQNNEKNIMKKKEYIKNIKEEYNEYKIEILDIFLKRYNNYTNIKENSEIYNLNKRLKTIEDVIHILNDKQTSYEKMKIDKNIYKLEKFYKQNLDDINHQIVEILKKFENVGIRLEIKDFKYNTYVTEYMKSFFEEYENRDINSKAIRQKFEEIYWKCPDIIILIELNLRNIYFEKKNSIDKYYEKEKNEILKKWRKTPLEINKIYLDLKQKKIEKELVDKKNIVNKFLNGTLEIKEFTEEKFRSNALRILPNNIVERVNEENQLSENVGKFLNSLYEYKNYLEFKFLIEDIREHYKEKESNKKVFEEIRKEILVKEKKLAKNNKNKFFSLLKVKKDTNNIQSQEIKEIEKLYKKLDLYNFYDKLASEITDNSTIQDVLEIAVNYYEYMISCIIKNIDGITQEEMDDKIYKLNCFLTNPYNNIINNLGFLETKDVALIIKDRYRLMDFTIEKENLEIENLEELIEITENIQTRININLAGIRIDELEEILKLKIILNIK